MGHDWEQLVFLILQISENNMTTNFGLKYILHSPVLVFTDQLQDSSGSGLIQLVAQPCPAETGEGPRGTKASTKDHPSTAMKLIHVVGQGAGAQNITQSQRRSPLTPGGDWNLRVNLDQQLNLPLLPTDDPATTPLAPLEVRQAETPCS